MGLLTKDVERHPCEVEVSHCFDSLHAHVKFTDGAVVYPGDEVIVKGPEIMAPIRGSDPRRAGSRHLSRIEGWNSFWTRLTGDFEFMELCEFSFSEEVKL